MDYGKLSDNELVQRFVDAGFKGIELYTYSEGPNSYDNFRGNVPVYGRSDFAVKSIHAPIAFKLDGKNEKFNLAYQDRIADKSLEVLADVANFSKRHGCEEITIHSWFINPPYEITKKQAHANMASNLAKISGDLRGVRVLAEVSPLILWGFPGIYDKQTVMVTKQDYQELFDEGNKHGINIGWDADIDHMFRTAIFAELYGKDGESYFAHVPGAVKSDNGVALREQACKFFLDYWYDKRQQAILKAHDYIDDMLVSLKRRIGHVSVTGADFVRHPDLEPEEGHGFEHFPVGYTGMITARNYKTDSFKPVEGKTINVHDSIMHHWYLPKVRDKPLILEFMSRDSTMGQHRKDYDFFEECVKQKDYLEAILVLSN